MKRTKHAIRRNSIPQAVEKTRDAQLDVLKTFQHAEFEKHLRRRQQPEEVTIKAKIKDALCKWLLGRIYDGQVLANHVPDVILAQAIRRKNFIEYMPDPSVLDDTVTSNGDPVRYAVLALAIHRLETVKVGGCFAEVGVYRGNTSRIIRHCAPERPLYLFDTFEGFPTDEQDTRFRDTTVDHVLKNIGNTENVTVVQGEVPETFKPYEDKTFSLVMLDLDKYDATLASLEFFYPRLAPGAYLFLHDYNSPESDWGVKKAFDLFVKDHPAIVVDIPDRCGSLLAFKP